MSRDLRRCRPGVESKSWLGLRLLARTDSDSSSESSAGRQMSVSVDGVRWRRRPPLGVGGSLGPAPLDGPGPSGWTLDERSAFREGALEGVGAPLGGPSGCTDDEVLPAFDSEGGLAGAPSGPSGATAEVRGPLPRAVIKLSRISVDGVLPRRLETLGSSPSAQLGVSAPEPRE
jgi:hypothetical protein